MHTDRDSNVRLVTTVVVSHNAVPYEGDDARTGEIKAKVTAHRDLCFSFAIE